MLDEEMNENKEPTVRGGDKSTFESKGGEEIDRDKKDKTTLSGGEAKQESQKK